MHAVTAFEMIFQEPLYFYFSPFWPWEWLLQHWIQAFLRIVIIFISTLSLSFWGRGRLHFECAFTGVASKLTSFLLCRKGSTSSVGYTDAHCHWCSKGIVLLTWVKCQCYLPWFEGVQYSTWFSTLKSKSFLISLRNIDWQFCYACICMADELEKFCFRILMRSFQILALQEMDLLEIILMFQREWWELGVMLRQNM